VIRTASRPAVNPLIAATQAPPVMEARRWLTDFPPPAHLPLINVSQAAPVASPPEGLRRAMAEAILSDPAAHLYGPVLGNAALREALADRMSAHYGSPVGAAQVAITSGCNMAFTAAMATLAGPGDEVILPLPWYFNHAMWLDMSGVRIRPLEPGPGLIPDPEAAAALITERTRAIVLVSPNNPGGTEYPAETVAAFRDLARSRGLALVIDETYRDFDSRDGAPHDLFADPGWDDTVIHLYSFSKAYRLTGHRVGALVASTSRLEQVEKYLDTVQINPPQPGQIGALWGLQHLSEWLAAERAEILARRAAVIRAAATLPGWDLLGCGAYFAYLRHPFAAPSPELARQLVAEAGILLLPGSFFRPAGDPAAARELRVAFANIDIAGIDELAMRLRGLALPLAHPGGSL